MKTRVTRAPAPRIVTGLSTVSSPFVSSYSPDGIAIVSGPGVPSAAASALRTLGQAVP